MKKQDITLYGIRELFIIVVNTEYLYNHWTKQLLNDRFIFRDDQYNYLIQNFKYGE